LFRTRLLAFLLLALIPIGFVPCAHAARSSKDLPPVYRHWLDAEVPYIISTVERKQFLALATDEQRDDFIQTFWKIRNPNPGSEANTYKDEHYRRLAYVNENFGDSRYADGWRTDRGRMYIVLGPPKQRTIHQDTSNVRPMEVWFYQAETPILPPYFYLIFYKQSAAEEFKLYSPRYDTPVRLCSTGESRNDAVQALGIIRRALGAEVAKQTVSLLPTEHVNLSDFEPSMESEALLNSISNLPDNPYTLERLQANRMREHVTTRIFLGENDATLSYGVFRDNRSRATLSYLLAMRVPDARFVGSRNDNSAYYDLTLRTEVETPDGNPVYQQEDQIKGNLTQQQAEVARKKRFAAEARLPLSAGTYKLQVTLTNNIDKTAVRQSTNVLVPPVKPGVVALSSLVAYSAPAGVPDPKDRLPFSASHFRFTPRGSQNVYIQQGEKLPLVFQLWLDPRTPASPASEKIHIRYEFGSVAASSHETTQENEVVDAANRDEAGNFLTGHTVDTSNLLPGTYQMVVSATREGGPRAGYATLNLHVAPSDGYVGTWTGYGSTEAPTEAADDYKRGLSAESVGADDIAIAFYERSLAESPEDLNALDHVVVLRSKKGQADQLAGLGKLQVLTKISASPSTLLSIAGALKKAGDDKSIVRIFEAQLKLQAPSIDLYNVLADAYQATGNSGHAKETRGLAADLKK